MDDRHLAELEKMLAGLADRPFGNTDTVSGRTLQPFSLAGQEAAGNLLRKALRALASGDEAKARGYVDHAVRLPYDRHEMTHPAASEASLALYTGVTDALEDAAEDDLQWLRAAGEAVAAAGPTGRQEMGGTLRALGEDHHLSRREEAALSELVATLPDGVDLRDQELVGGALADAVMDVLVVCEAYERAAQSSDG